MNKTQEHFSIEEAQSEIRTRVLEIRALPDDKLTPELRSERDELDQKYAAGEVKFRASLKSLREGQEQGVTVVDSEARELQRLTERASVGDVFASVVERRATTGETAELQSHCGLQGNEMPLSMLRGVEKRAVTTTAANTQINEQPVIAPVFSLGDTAFMNVAQETVEPGAAVWPVLSVRPSVGGPYTDSTSAAETNGTFGADLLSPQRLSASYRYRQSDAVRFRGMSEGLRQALNQGLSEAIDAQTVAQIVSDVSRTARTTTSNFAHYKSRLTSSVDGRFAGMESDVKMLIGTPTLIHGETLYKSSESPESAIDLLRRTSGGVKVSAFVPGVSSNRQDILVRKGARLDAVAALWDRVIIDDSVTKAQTGEVVLTAVLYAAFKVVRTDGFARLQVQHT